VSQIREIEKAKQIYDDALASGHGAFLLEQKSSPTILSVSVGNLPPKKCVLISVEYVMEIRLEAERLKVTLPALPFAPNLRQPTPKVIEEKKKR